MKTPHEIIAHEIIARETAEKIKDYAFGEFDSIYNESDHEKVVAMIESALTAATKDLRAKNATLRETLVAIRAINVTEFGTEADAGINRLIDSCAALAQG